MLGALAPAALVLVAVVALVWPQLDRKGSEGDDGRQAAQQSSPTTATGAAPPRSSSPASRSKSPTAPTPTTAPSTKSSLPADFRLQHDPTGFDIAVPRGWSRSVRGSSVYFRQPGGRSYLQVDTTTHPKADTLPDWKAQEASAPSRFAGYHLIRLERVDYRDWNTADWEFTWRPSGGQLHVLNRNIRINDHRAYALLWSVPAADWTERRRDFQTIAQTFEPAD